MLQSNLSEEVPILQIGIVVLLSMGQLRVCDAKGIIRESVQLNEIANSLDVGEKKLLEKKLSCCVEVTHVDIRRLVEVVLVGLELGVVHGVAFLLLGRAYRVPVLRIVSRFDY